MNTRNLILLTLCAACLLGRARALPDEGTTNTAMAGRLVQKAQASLTAGQLGLALLQFSQAQRMHPAMAAASAVAEPLATAAQAEARLLDQGLGAAEARDLRAVQQAVRELRKLDRHSSAALEVVLRYQAALADHGGAFARARWADIQTTR